MKTRSLFCFLLSCSAIVFIARFSTKIDHIAATWRPYALVATTVPEQDMNREIEPPLEEDTSTDAEAVVQADVDAIFAEMQQNGQPYVVDIEDGTEHFYIDATQYPEDMTHDEIMALIMEQNGRESAEMIPAPTA